MATVGTRVRLAEHSSPEDLRDGRGSVRRMEGDIPVVAWDAHSGVLIVREDPTHLIEVTPRCSYAKARWKRGTKWGIEGMIVVCDVHDMPAAAKVYDVDVNEITSVTDLCARFPEYWSLV